MSEYSAVSAKIRAMYGGCFKQSDYEAMLSKSTVPEMCGYLKNETAYKSVFSDIRNEDMHRELIEKQLWQELTNEYVRIYNFLDGDRQELLEFWFNRIEVRFLKNCLRKIFNHEKMPEDGYSNLNPFMQKHSQIDTELCMNAETIADFTRACEHTKYEDIFKRAERAGADYFTVAMTLDGFCYKGLIDKAEATIDTAEFSDLKRLIGSRCDMLNIMWIYRGKKYFQFDPKLIYTYIIPVRYALTKEAVRGMVEAPSADAIPVMLATTKYKNLFKNLEDGYFPEENYRRIIYSTARYCFRNRPNTMAAVFSYLYLKEFEVLNITRAIEGVRYGLSRDSILNHIRIGQEEI